MKLTSRPFSFRGSDYICVEWYCIFWGVRQQNHRNEMRIKGLCLLGHPGIDWPKARDLESERQLSAPVIVLKHHQINFAVYYNKEIWYCDMVRISESATSIISENCLGVLYGRSPGITFITGHNVRWQASCSALCTIKPTLKILEHCEYVCFIALAVVAEIASVSLNLKVHKTSREKAKGTACYLGLAVFHKSWSFMFSASNYFTCFNDECSCFVYSFSMHLTNDL